MLSSKVKSNKGFTLIELLIVIAIIAIMSGVVMAGLSTARIKSRDAKRLATLKEIRNALEFYVNENRSYPGSSGTYYWISDNNYPGTSGYPPCATSGGLQPYLNDICNIKDPQGYPYAYSIDNGVYKLGARFELSANQVAPFTYNNGVTSVANYYIQQ